MIEVALRDQRALGCVSLMRERERAGSWQLLAPGRNYAGKCKGENDENVVRNCNPFI
jgi:hypothetical protein